MANLQQYPRLPNDLLDDSKLVPHIGKIPVKVLKDIISAAIETASKKSSRAIVDLPEDATQEETIKAYTKEGKKLFSYFVTYCGDAASTALNCAGRMCTEVAQEQFKVRSLQKQRMNSAWRYQYIAKDAASASKRFDNVSDIGLAEADFNVVVSYQKKKAKLTIYVSVKNRSNTMGGQDWPKAIAALETVASTDKNRVGHYICVFGLSVERGGRLIRRDKKHAPFSWNTELWRADFFWPFFSNCSYEKLSKLVLDVLLETKTQQANKEEIPRELLDSFQECCAERGLIDNKGHFADPYRLLEFFCGDKGKKIKKPTS